MDVSPRRASSQQIQGRAGRNQEVRPPSGLIRARTRRFCVPIGRGGPQLPRPAILGMAPAEDFVLVDHPRRARALAPRSEYGPNHVSGALRPPIRWHPLLSSYGWTWPDQGRPPYCYGNPGWEQKASSTKTIMSINACRCRRLHWPSLPGRNPFVFYLWRGKASRTNRPPLTPRRRHARFSKSHCRSH